MNKITHSTEEIQEPVTLKDRLVNYSVVELKNGNRYLLAGNTLLNLEMHGGYLPLSNYDENLQNRNNFSENLQNRNNFSDKESWDIVKFNNNALSCLGHCNRALFEVVNQQEWTWEREKEIQESSINSCEL